jgi:hypothetical protein
MSKFRRLATPPGLTVIWLAGGPAKEHTKRKMRGDMWKLERSRDGDFLVLNLCGRIELEQLEELQRVLASEAKGQKIAFDLNSVRLVDQDAVTFLARCEVNGIRLDNCPAYIREWVTRAKTKATQPYARQTDGIQ